MTEPAKPTSTLSRRVLRNIALRIGIVALVLTAISYYYSYWRFQEEALANLGKYIAARSQLESEPFLQAEINTRRLRDEFVRRMALYGETDPAPRFHQLFSQERDGIWRVRLELDDFEHQATVALLPNVKLTPEFMRQVLVGFDLASQYGPAHRSRYYDTFIDLNVSDGSIIFLPDLNYARNGSVADFAADLPTEVGATPARNPERKTFWTGIYFDKQAIQWMVSVVTPIDYLGRFVGGAGQDVLLDELIERTNNVSIPGTHNFIVTRDGDLVAHPARMGKIREAGGGYRVTEVEDLEVRSLYEAALKATPNQPFVESPDGSAWLGVAPIKGANWLFVSVYPKRLLQEKAALAASMVLLLGLIALVLELAVMAWTLRHDVAMPLARLKQAIVSLAAGKRSDNLDTGRDDELGEVARTFDGMATTIEQHRHNLEELVERRTEELAVRNMELEAANLRLTQLNEEKNELLTIAAHDLKNPVASIQGMTNLIVGKLGEWSHDRVEDRLLGIVKLSERMQRILGNLLDINALEAGQYHLRPERVLLDGLCTELVASWEMRLVEKQQLCIYTPCGLNVMADRQALWQVLDNLISNASKYAPHQTAIRLEAIAIGERVQVRVSDQGPGIATHEMERLFRKFSRLSAVPTGGEHTTGLGLSIVKRLAEAMDGKVGCESVLGHGATFYVELPLAQARLEP
ncbi:sensor histidine kinase [Chitinolyticbacter meiyuanensis]|uniref:sensor histidine kinase n=1 Tax=Chitinolyticbacter meiyuanensis TaxID=682798 RepID=UPI0011E5F856|nr:ATP-binding protein [Chitinolyticbacter meiyuanensis]